MPKKKTEDTENSWRKIPQSRTRRKSSPLARKRSLRTLYLSSLALLGIAAVFVLAAGGWLLLREATRSLSQGLQSPVLEDEKVLFQTDGYLTVEWLLEELALTGAHQPIFSLSLTELRERLESNGQVDKAILAVLPPDRLAVRLQERKPVLRMVARNSDGERMRLLVGQDGLVYEGYGYPLPLLRSLPHVDIDRVSHSDHGFGQLPGFPQVAELLRIAEEETPEMYRTWRVVSLRQLPKIVVQSDNVGQAIFPDRDFEENVLRLRDLVRGTRREGYDRLEMVDLSLEHVPMRPSSR
ncbi:MAG: FtsQ-type POTRA domain-containing protein [Opitutales bacterium]|nr:FtsQ-type POTRA domain-containing protein [Opitutales bacterium]